MVFLNKNLTFQVHRE